MKSNQGGFGHIEALITFVVIGIISSVGWFVYQNQKPKATYQSVADDFITAVQKKDKISADALQTANAAAYAKEVAGTSSFYEICHKAGTLCEPLFTSDFISKAKKTTKTYTAKDGTKGIEVVYALTQTLQGDAAGGEGCSSVSHSSLKIDIVPRGNTWAVDNFEPSIEFSAELCGTKTSASSSPSTTAVTSTPPSKPATHSTTPAVSKPAPQPETALVPAVVSISADGCYVTATTIPGMTFIAGAYQGNHGGDSTYTIPASGTMTVTSGGAQNYMAYGKILDASGAQIAYYAEVISASQCPAPSSWLFNWNSRRFVSVLV